MRFLIAIKGRGSRELANMKPGEEAELTGPLGKSWPFELVPKGPIALIGGGIGIAPLLMLASELEKKRCDYDFYAGFRGRSFGLENLKARSLVIASEDGSEGKKGYVTDFFKAKGYGMVYACGPEAMLIAVANDCKASGVPCFISVERHMACGVGACLGCTVNTIAGNRRCCVDGPVFNAEELCFEG